MFTPNQVVRLTGWFDEMEKNRNPDQMDIDLIKQISELLKDVEGSEGEDYITYKEYYEQMKNVFIPKMERLYIKNN